MISYTLTNATFDIGTRSDDSTNCDGLYNHILLLYQRNVVPQLKVTYEAEDGDIDCLLTFAGHQTANNHGSFIFQNGIISVTVDDEDNVAVASFDEGGGGTDLEDLPWVNLWTNPAPYTTLEQTTINIDVGSASPKYWRVVYSANANDSRSIIYMRAGSAYRTSIRIVTGDTTNWSRLRTLDVNLTNLTLTISDCKQAYYNASVIQMSNSYMIPVSVDYIE